MLFKNQKTLCRITATLLAVVLVLSLTACSSTKDDSAFLKNLQRGLEARWKVSNQMDDETYSSASEYRDHLLSCVNAELDKLGEYTDYQFTDSNLASLAEIYFNSLNSQLDGYKYYGVDDTKYEEQFSQSYYQRAEVLYLLCQDYSFSVSNTYASTLEEMVIVGETYHEINSALSAIETQVAALILERTGTSEYSFSITNTSEMSFEYAELVLTGYDENGVNTATGSYYLSNWNSGSTVNDKLWIDGEFRTATAQVVVNHNYQDYTFEPVEIEIHDNLIVDISIPSTPIAVSYTSGRTLTTTCEISDITYSVDNWYEGTATVHIYISGEKTYDKSGDTHSRSCRIGWKLYDDSGAVIDSGNCNSGDCSVGEQFKNAAIYIYDLTPGNYRLEILDVI